MCGEGNETEVGEQLRTAAVTYYLEVKRRRKNLEGQMNNLRAKRNIPYITINSCEAEDLQIPEGNQKEQ